MWRRNKSKRKPKITHFHLLMHDLASTNWMCCFKHLGVIIFLHNSTWVLILFSTHSLEVLYIIRKLLNSVPAGWPGSSLRVACPHKLGHIRFTPSVSTWKEVNKGAPSRPFALHRSSQLARNIKGDTPSGGGRK